MRRLFALVLALGVLGAAPAALAQAPADPLEVALVIDTSGSMAGAPLAAAKAAARTLLNQLPATAPVAVVGFGATPVLASGRSSDRGAQLAAIDALQARGQTAMYDAVQLGARQLGAGRRFVVLLSDGGDTTSQASLEDTVAVLTSANVTVFAVELVTPESSSSALARLASATGGRTVAASDPAALSGLFDTIGKQLLTAAATTVPAPAPAVTPAPKAQDAPGGGFGWGLWLGTGLVAAALLLVLVPTFAFRTPRSRALGGGRWAPMRQASERAEGLAERVLHRGGWVQAINAVLERAGVDLRPGELVAAVAIAAAVAALAGTLLAGPVVGLLGAAAILVGVRTTLAVMEWRRRQRFADQLGDTLQMLAGSLRAGYGLSQAVDVVGREAESPTADEFRRLTVETRLGRDLGEALHALGGRVRSQDFQWVVQAFEIHREVGGDLAEVLDSVAGTIRDRNRVRGQVRALSAEGRMSALVLFVLPFVLAAVTSVLDPSYLRELTDSGAGIAMLAGGGVLLGVGGLWLRRIVKPTF